MNTSVDLSKYFFELMITGTGFLFIYFFKNINKRAEEAIERADIGIEELKHVSKEISSLNQKITVLIEKDKVTTKELERINDIITKEKDRVQTFHDLVKDRLHDLGNSINSLETGCVLNNGCKIPWAQKSSSV
jgi:hypothetical protein